MKVSKLIYDNTKNSSDLFYRTSFKAPDPILFIEFRNKKYLILNDLEIERGKSEAKVDSVLPLSSISRKIKSNSIEQVILHLLKEFKIKTIEVPYNFPSYIYKKLTKSKIKVMPSKSPIFFNSRIVKNQTEIKSISKVMRHTEKVMRLIIEKIKYSKSKNKILIYNILPIQTLHNQNILVNYSFYNNIKLSCHVIHIFIYFIIIRIT